MTAECVAAAWFAGTTVSCAAPPFSISTACIPARDAVLLLDDHRYTPPSAGRTDRRADAVRTLASVCATCARAAAAGDAGGGVGNRGPLRLVERPAGAATVAHLCGIRRACALRRAVAARRSDLFAGRRGLRPGYRGRDLARCSRRLFYLAAPADRSKPARPPRRSVDRLDSVVHSLARNIRNLQGRADRGRGVFSDLSRCDGRGD